jgi:hypothetical protein
MLVDVFFGGACIARNPSTVRIVMHQSIALGENDQFLAGNIVFLNCLTNDNFRDPLKVRIDWRSNRLRYVRIDVSGIPGLNSSIPSRFQ